MGKHCNPVSVHCVLEAPAVTECMHKGLSPAWRVWKSDGREGPEAAGSAVPSSQLFLISMGAGGGCEWPLGLEIRQVCLGAQGGVVSVPRSLLDHPSTLGPPQGPPLIRHKPTQITLKVTQAGVPRAEAETPREGAALLDRGDGMGQAKAADTLLFTVLQCPLPGCLHRSQAGGGDSCVHFTNEQTEAGAASEKRSRASLPPEAEPALAQPRTGAQPLSEEQGARSPLVLPCRLALPGPEPSP